MERAMFPGMNRTELERMARDYIRLIRLGFALHWLPLRLAYRLLALAALHWGPLRHGCEAFEGYARAAGCPADELDRWWHLAMARHGMLFVNNALFRKQVGRIAALVRDRDEAWKQMVAEPNGALVLTCHHDFYHLLFVLAGLEGCCVRPVVMPEKGSPLSPWLETHLQGMHAACAQHFNGGDYLFIVPGQTRGRVREALQRGETVFSLHDGGGGRLNDEGVILGRRYHPVIGTIEEALAAGKPIYFAAVLWCDSRFAYRIQCSHLSTPSLRPIEFYTSALDALVREHAYAWSGWQWLSDFEPIPSAESLRT
jgi:hypothetical protein